MKIELKDLINSLDLISKTYLEEGAIRCISRGGNEIIIEDILYVMLKNKNSLINKLILQYKIDVNNLLNILENSSIIATESKNPIFSVLLVTWLEESYYLTIVEFSSNTITEESMILSFLENIFKYSNTKYFRFFESINKNEAKDLIKGLKLEDTKKEIIYNKETELEKYTINLTKLARNNELDMVLCREDEIKQVIDILLRRRKNNPILVGEAGVGKSAVVEGLAIKIINKDVPIELYDSEILMLDIGALQAGASVKGEFERRFQSIIKEIQSSAKKIILFVDEAHTLFGAGGSEGTSDAANLLKPILARGGLKTIAATTWLEYRKYFEKDPALSRRFQKIDIFEPSIQDTITILRGISKKYEEAHNVYIEDEALVNTAILSARYINGRQLPDKAIDVLDTACANVKISKTNIPFELQKLNIKIKEKERELDSLQRDSGKSIKDYSNNIKVLEDDISELRNTLEYQYSCFEKEKELLLKLKIETNKESIEEIQNKLNENYSINKFIQERVSKDEIAKVISSWTGVPLGNMVSEQIKNVMELENNLQKRVIGQNKAIEYLSKFLQIFVSGLKKENSPSGVFLLVGPSGVGKTETARAIADLMYGGEKFLTVINMTEFQEKHTVSRLIGSPPGYVGYGEGGQLTDAVRVRPYSVVLFDEIEKAHPDILNIFYQIFDRGEINDSEGRIIDFRNTTILMTSNLATDLITDLYLNNKNISFDEITKEIVPVLSKYLKPALLGRMNVVPYLNLEDEALKLITKIKLDYIVKQFEKKDILLTLEDSLFDYIVTLSNSIDTGARNIDLIINLNILPKLSKVYLDSVMNKSKIIEIQVSIDENKEIYINLKGTE
ncbi:type VI secretion system ATPase TssH [Aliarcobacter skirrowii]|uniref:Chaperone protein ClpB n=1 Tax=Aliarcobacter skirrowii CCUG 10374 TaxID=1032239 RepID=A0AAD0WN84_9BACT|nr:type VI secretion system ATPase TssH [Aliarcobacter skirrowii]AXX84627.1 type VI secretion system, ClpV1 family ATPase TssH [Aliarcobacter skirrowii CCUG 10374]KAB0619469.1 type VI secretion system ATPase TssH [Aliarcobacter skirrowii CCUG 10374]RXI24689.1 type VI secretion system ATPase TssH [Aliarcobacter skirrowii CCUG 10374]SUV14794.1 protein disaggregation chaperone [Aliarcobacter skirrowii]